LEALKKYWNLFGPSLLVIIFYFSEATSKAFVFYEGHKWLPPKYIKFSCLVFFAAYLFFKNVKTLLGPILLGLIFIVGQFFLEDAWQNQIIVSFSKYLFPIFLFLFFNSYQFPQQAKKNLIKAFDFILIFNSCLIILGFIFEVALLKTYSGHRFGYNGMFLASSTGSYAYSLAILGYLFRFKNKFFTNYKSLLTLLAGILIGTKSFYMALFVALLSFIIFYSGLTLKQKKAFFLGAVGLVASLFYYFFYISGEFNAIRNEKGLVDAILSFRNSLLTDQLLPFIDNNWSLPNYLFGGITDLHTRSQMAFIDVFYFWGILGGLFYLFIYFKSYLTVKIRKPEIYYFPIILVIAFLGGNFFFNASTAIYLLIFREIIHLQNNTEKPIQVS